MPRYLACAPHRLRLTHQVLGLPHTRIIYVESFARVSSLSLSARLLKPFVDRFVVQWPDLVPDSDPTSASSPRTRLSKAPDSSAVGVRNVEYRGWLV